MSRQYVIEVQTGNAENAGTDADVYTQLLGEIATTPELYLNDARNNFEKGRRDQFRNVSTDEVGWIDRIRLFHCNNGDKPGWYVNYIKVTDPLRGLSWRVDLNRWLALDEDDGRIDITTDVPIGPVALTSGVMKQIYLGYVTRRFSNQGAADTINEFDFSWTYRRGCSLDLSKSRTQATNMDLGFSCFLGDAKFSHEVTTAISRDLGTTEEEVLEFTVHFSYPVAAGQSMTVVMVFYQCVLEGTASGSGVSVDYSQKFTLTYDPLISDGILSEQQVEDRVRQLLMDALGVNLMPPLAKTNAWVPLREKKLPVTDRSSIQNAKAGWAGQIIQPRHLSRFSDAHVLLRPPHTRTRTIGAPRSTVPRVPVHT